MPTTWTPNGTNYVSLAYSAPASATETTQTLNSAYTYGSAGSATAWTFISQESANLTDFWIKVVSYNGTWGSTDGVVNVQIRQGLNGSNIPGTTLTGSFTITLDGSTTGWIKKSGLSIALTAGQLYSCVVGDADGGTTNYVTVASRYSPPSVTGSSLTYITGSSFTTSNGFSTAGTNGTGQPAFVAKVGLNVFGGCGFSTVATTTSSQNERGMRFKPTEDCTFVGFYIPNDSSMLIDSAYTFKLYADATAPGGTPIVSFTPQDVAAGTAPVPIIVLVPNSSETDLTGGVWYRVAVYYTVDSTTPRKATVGGSPDVDVLSVSMPFNGNAHYIEQSGAAWDDSQTSALSTFGPVLLPKTATAGGVSLLNRRDNSLMVR